MDIQKSALMIAILSSVCIFSFFVVSFLGMVEPIDFTNDSDVQDESPIGSEVKISEMNFTDNIDQETQNLLLDFITGVTSQNNVINYSAAIVKPQTNEVTATFNKTYSYKFGNAILPLIYTFLVEQKELSPGSKLSDGKNLREGLQNHILTNEIKTIIKTDEDFIKLMKALSLPGNPDTLLSTNEHLPFQSLLNFYNVLSSQKSYDLISSQSSFVINDFISVEGISNFSNVKVDMNSVVTSVSYSNEHLVFLVFEIMDLEDSKISEIRRLASKVLESVNVDDSKITKPDGVIQSEYCELTGEIKDPEDDCESFLEWNMTENY